ncbi:MAG: ParA family protein [Leucobacter sp.]
MSAEIIVFAGQKGGVGKTTSALNLGAAFQRRGGRVLLVDMDPQADLTTGAGLELAEDAYTVYDVLRGDVTPEAAIVSCDAFDVLPTTDALAMAEIELGGRPGRELLLRRMLEPVIGSYDWIMIDCPRGFGLLALNGLAMATLYVVAVQTQHFAVKHVDSLVEVAGEVAEFVNPQLRFGGYLPTMFNASKRQHNARLEEIRERAEAERVPLLPTIRENVALADAQSAGQTIFLFRPQSHGAEDYEAVAQAIAEQVKSRG